MTQLQYSTGSFRVSRERTTHTPQQRLFGLAFAVAMEAAIVYALLVTLGYVEAPQITPPLTIVNVAPLPNNPDVPPPPPQTFEPPRVETVITPVVELTYTPPTPPTTISLPPALPVPPTCRAWYRRRRRPWSSRRRARSRPRHTIPEYPFVSRRLREQGTLRLKLTVDEKGLVTAGGRGEFERLPAAGRSGGEMGEGAVALHAGDAGHQGGGLDGRSDCRVQAAIACRICERLERTNCHRSAPRADGLVKRGRTGQHFRRRASFDDSPTRSACGASTSPRWGR